MTTSKKVLRRTLALKVPGAYTGTASSESSTTELYDTDDDFLTFAGEGGVDLTGTWVIRADAAAAGDRIRRIVKHDLGLGRLVVSRAWTNGPSTETYEIWPADMRPALVDQAIDDGLVRLSYRVEGTVTPASQNNSYSLAALTWITSERDVREVWYQYTSTNLVTRQPWPWWSVYDKAGAFTLHLDPSPYTTTGLSLIVEGVAHYGSLANDTATTAAPADWAIAGAQVELYRKVIRDIKGQANPAWAADYIEARREFNRLSRRYTPRVPRRMQYRAATRMPGVGQVRRGEFQY